MKNTLFAFALLIIAARGADPQIIVRSKILSIPVDSPALAKTGLVMDPAGGMQNLGLIDSDRAAAILAQLGKAKDVNVMSAPTVTTKDGQKATVEVVREFMYPTEFDPGVVKEMKDSKPVTLKPGESFAATPVTPTAFEMRPLGIRMEFTPELQSDGSIDLQLTPEITTFDGFIDYGTPIKAASADAKGKLSVAVLTENKIQQPVFQKMKVSTSVTLHPGQFLLFGGLGAATKNSTVTSKPDLNQKADLKAPKPDRLYFFMIEVARVAE